MDEENRERCSDPAGAAGTTTTARLCSRVPGASPHFGDVNRSNPPFWGDHLSYTNLYAAVHHGNVLYVSEQKRLAVRPVYLGRNGTER